MLNADWTALLAVDANDTVTTHPFPGFSVRDWSYNYLAADRKGYLYTITNDGRVVRSNDLTTWETIVAASNKQLITIAYWPERNWIVVAERGSAGKLWRIDLGPEPTISRTGNTITLDWADTAASYRVYRSTDPFFTSERFKPHR